MLSHEKLLLKRGQNTSRSIACQTVENFFTEPTDQPTGKQFCFFGGRVRKFFSGFITVFVYFL